MTTDSIGFMITDIARLMRQAFQQRLEGSNLTLAQARVLLYVARHPEGMRQVELAEWLEVQPITLTRLIDQLAKAGVVERHADPLDRRAFRILLTPAAAPELAMIEQVINQVRQQALQGLSDQESTQLLQALGSMRDNLSQRTDKSRQ